jgi:hypothetical protein
MHLIEASAQSAAQLHAMALHAAALEAELREQQRAVVQAEAACQEAVAAHLAMTHDMDSLKSDRERLQVELEHYTKRIDELLAERGRGTQQLAELGRSVSDERQRARLEVGKLHDVISDLEEKVRQGLHELELRDAQNEQLEAQNEQLEAQNEQLESDLREVMTLIDQIEGEPGFASAATEHLRKPFRLRSPSTARAAAALTAASSASLSASTKAAVRATAARLVAVSTEGSSPIRTSARAVEAAAAAAARKDETGDETDDSDQESPPDERTLQALWLRGPEALGTALSRRARRGKLGTALSKLGAAHAALALCKGAMGRLEAELAVLRSCLVEVEASEAEANRAASRAVSSGSGGGHLEEEAALLREENRLLEAQLALLSEKAYGSPAKLAALERDRLQIELEAERHVREGLEQHSVELGEALDEARRTQQSLKASGLVDELEKMRQALQAAQATLIHAASAQMPTPNTGRALPVRAGYNPIAMPRRQFGAADLRAEALRQSQMPRSGTFQAPWSSGGVAPPTPWTSGRSSARTGGSYRSSRGSSTPAAYFRAPSISHATPR